MEEYHKIKTVYKRDPETKFKTLLIGDWALPEFEYLALNDWEWTEKVDGMNIRVMWDCEQGELAFRGKTDRAEIPKPLFAKLHALFCFEMFAQMFPNTSVCLYGEGYGTKIQKGGGNYRQDQSFVLFDVKIEGWWLQREDLEGIARGLNIDVVPIIGKGNLSEMVQITQKGFNSQWGDFLAEGIVARPSIGLKARNGSRIITKIKHKDFK